MLNNFPMSTLHLSSKHASVGMMKLLSGKLQFEEVISHYFDCKQKMLALKQ